MFYYKISRIWFLAVFGGERFCQLVYLIERLINMREVIPQALNEDEDVLCIF